MCSDSDGCNIADGLSSEEDEESDDEKAGGVDAVPEAHTATEGGKRLAAARAKPKANAKKVAAKGKAGKKTEGGLRWCRGCTKKHNLDEFAPGSQFCYPMKKATQNLKKSCATEKEEEWWLSVLADDIRLPKVCGLYMQRCPEPVKQAGKQAIKRKAPVTLEYMEEERQEELLILDGIKDMKNLPGFQTFMSLPENGSMANEDSALLFQQRYAIPSWPKDRNSDHPKHKERIAVKVADRIIESSQHVKSKGIRTIDMNKKASEEDVLAARKN